MTSKPSQLRAELRRPTSDPSPRGPRAAHRKLNRTPSQVHPNTIGRFAACLTAGFALGLIAPTIGCAGPGVPAEPPRSGDPPRLPLTVTADWNDIDASIDRASPRAAVAPLSAETEPAEDRRTRRVTLLAIDGQRAAVTFEAPRGEDPVPITISATFGRPDDAARSAALVQLIADELEALAGRGVAPR